jgi:dTDP-glucose 4,6-dehydratase
LSRIFITGIDGVLGSTLATKLRSRGHDVFGCGLAHSSDPRVTRGDVSKPRQFAQALDAYRITEGDYSPIKDYDLLFHFAAEFGRKNGQAYYEDLWTTNCIGTRNVIEECERREIPLVFSSSSEAYGLSEQYNQGRPLREEMLDTHPPQFHNEYALSKYTNERQILTACRNTSLRAIILRFFNIYGPPERFTPYRSVVCQFAWKMLSNQKIIVNREGERTHLWIGDWANTVSNIANETTLDALLKYSDKKWLGAGGTPGVPVFNVGGTEYETIEGLYNRLHDLIPDYDGSLVTFIDKEEANSATKEPDNTLATIFLGHNPVRQMREGLEETVNYLKGLL